MGEVNNINDLVRTTANFKKVEANFKAIESQFSSENKSVVVLSKTDGSFTKYIIEKSSFFPGDNYRGFLSVVEFKNRQALDTDQKHTLTSFEETLHKLPLSTSNTCTSICLSSVELNVDKASVPSLYLDNIAILAELLEKHGATNSPVYNKLIQEFQGGKPQRIQTKQNTFDSPKVFTRNPDGTITSKEVYTAEDTGKKAVFIEQYLDFDTAWHGRSYTGAVLTDDKSVQDAVNDSKNAVDRRGRLK